MITLTEDQKKIRIIFRVILGICTCIAGALFAKELLFPTYVFQFRSAIDSLANTISRPYVTEFGTTFDVATHGEFTRATVTITLPENAPALPRHTNIAVRHGYRAFFAPFSAEKYTDHLLTTYEIDGKQYLKRNGELYPFFSDTVFSSYLFAQNTTLPIESSTDLLAHVHEKEPIGFSSGSLVKSSDGVFVIDGATKHPFQDELSLTALGYQFVNILPSTNDERALHEKSRMFTMSSDHPFGTIFFARDADRMYIYDRDELHKIETDITAKNHAIITDELSRTTFDVCTLSRRILKSRTYSCTIPLSSVQEFSGNVYQFVIDAPQVQIEESHISLSTTPSHASFSQRITMIKNELRKYYQTKNE